MRDLEQLHHNQGRWHQYDLYSTGSTVVISTLNVLRSTMHSGSTKLRLRSTQVAYLVVIATHLCVLWLLLHRPALHARLRSLLTSSRWLTVAGLIIASTGLPVFQEGAASTSTWWLQRCVGMAFRSGLMFCLISFLFYRMPWQHMAWMAFTYAAASSLTTREYCTSVVAAHGSRTPHADFRVLQEAAALLDMLVAQGQQQEGVPHASTGAGVVAAAAASATDARWEPTARLLLAACSGGSLQGSSACSEALLGQCQATLVTLKFGLSYVLLLLTVSLEHYNKWHYLQQNRTPPMPSNAAQGGDPAPSPGPAAAGSGHISTSSGGSSGGSSRQGLAVDPLRAQSVWALLRFELLKLVVLADIPILLLWHLLSSILRPDLTQLQVA